MQYMWEEIDAHVIQSKRNCYDTSGGETGAHSHGEQDSAQGQVFSQSRRPVPPK